VLPAILPMVKITTWKENIIWEKHFIGPNVATPEE
jgi:hypothetical protein